MTERDKIIKIVQPYISAWGADESLTDALIADGIGDVSEWKRRAGVAEQKATVWKDCANKWQKYYKEQAEKEFTGEKKDE